MSNSALVKPKHAEVLGIAESVSLILRPFPNRDVEHPDLLLLVIDHFVFLNLILITYSCTHTVTRSQLTL